MKTNSTVIIFNIYFQQYYIIVDDNNPPFVDVNDKQAFCKKLCKGWL